MLVQQIEESFAGRLNLINYDKTTQRKECFYSSDLFLRLFFLLMWKSEGKQDLIFFFSFHISPFFFVQFSPSSSIFFLSTSKNRELLCFYWQTLAFFAFLRFSFFQPTSLPSPITAHKWAEKKSMHSSRLAYRSVTKIRTFFKRLNSAKRLIVVSEGSSTHVGIQQSTNTSKWLSRLRRSTCIATHSNQQPSKITAVQNQRSSTIASLRIRRCWSINSA